MASVDIRSNYTLKSFDRGQQEIRNEIITLGKTLKTTVSAKITLDESNNIVRIKLLHPGED